MYKLVDGKLEKAPKAIMTDVVMIGNPTDEQLIELGYKPYAPVDMPEVDTHHYCVKRLVELDDRITDDWDILEIVEEIEETAE